MKFGFSIENTSGECKLKFILRKSHFWGSRGPKTPKFLPFLLNWKSASTPEFISQPMPMKFGFSIENTSGHCKLKSILRKSHFWGSRSPKTPKFSPFFRELETNANEIRFQYRKYLRPVQVKVHFAKFAFWGVQGPKNAEIFAVFVNKSLGSCPEFISQPMPMKFWFSRENTSGECKMTSILRKSHFWGSRGPKTPKFSPFL